MLTLENLNLMGNAYYQLIKNDVNRGFSAGSNLEKTTKIFSKYSENLKLETQDDQSRAQ